MSVELLTRADLHQFKSDLITELKQLFAGSPPHHQKKWLKSWEVREMLGISRGTLQNMRENGSLPATKIGNLMFYDYEDIVKLMKNKNPPRR